jgi:hypothetical protein
MLAQMLSQLLLLLAADGRLSAAQMDLRFKRPQPPLLANQFSHYSFAHSKPLGERRVAPFLVEIRSHNPLP